MGFRTDNKCYSITGYSGDDSSIEILNDGVCAAAGITQDFIEELGMNYDRIEIKVVEIPKMNPKIDR